MLIAIGSATVISPDPTKVILKVPAIAFPLSTFKVNIPESELILVSEACVIAPV